MFKNRLLLIHLGFVLGTALVNAQARYSERQLDKRVDQYSFEEAVTGYESLVKNNKHKGPVTYLKIANLYYNRSLYKQAVAWYEKLVNTSPQILSDYEVYCFSNALRSLGQYEQSDFWIERYNLSAKMPAVVDVKDKVQGLKEIKLTKLTNSESDILYVRGFVTGTDEVLATKFTEPASYSNDKAFTNIYSFEIEGSIASNLELFEVDYDTKFNMGDAIMTRDGKTLYFSSNVSKTLKEHKKAKKPNQYALFQASLLENGMWTNITELSFNINRLFSSGHPSLSPNEDWMYFASDRFGGEGGMDIYRVKRYSDGSFGTPENLGPTINTPFQEGFPSVVNDTLYFSSNAHTNLGGLDIFYSVLTDEGFSEPKNLGIPINSPADDFAFLQHPSGKKTLLTSNRLGDGDEIFLFEGNLNAITTAQRNCRDSIQGQVVDFTTRKPVSFATVTIYSENQLLEEIQTDSLGMFVINKPPCPPYIFEVAATKGKLYMPFAAISLSGDVEGTVVLPLEINTKDLILEPIYFDLDSSLLTNEAEAVMDKLVEFLEQYTSVKIEIRSHTDSRATQNYNEWLSEKRATKTYNYLVSKGISPARLSRQSFGESQLTNECKDNVDCLEEYHRLNRRTEFIIINE